jgi:alkanesulfonate monooxygenase SsuD/methylene tetrahydromethanopterin reductase-like flavin-dependent oxidoreductase (luciferase family)
MSCTKFYVDKPIKVLTQKRLITMMFERNLLGKIRDDFPWKPVHERIQIMRKAVEIIKKLWTQSRTTYFGKYFNVKEAHHEPKPIQKPHPAIWIGGNISAMLKETTENGNGWIPYHLTP